MCVPILRRQEGLVRRVRQTLLPSQVKMRRYMTTRLLLLFNLQDTGTWYVSFLWSGTGTPRYSCNGTVDNCARNLAGSSPVVDAVLSTAGASAALGLYFNDNTGTFAGDISEICISDTEGACAGGSSAASSTTTAVDSAVDDLYHGVVIFLVGFWGVIWFFRKNR